MEMEMLLTTPGAGGGRRPALVSQAIHWPFLCLLFGIFVSMPYTTNS